ncbi:MAG: endolytic transglycosylase MltG [Endomicrobiales bacterium]
MNKKWLAAAFAVVCVAVLAAWWLGLPPAPVMVTIPRGAPARKIAAELKKAGVISSERLFVTLLTVSGLSTEVKAGSYSLSPRLSMFTIMRMLRYGQARYARVTVPEGFTAAQVAALLASQGVTDPAEFLGLVARQKCEGYLFPETYFFEPGTAAEKVVARMTDEFRRRFTPLMQQRARELKMDERDIVTLASIIEKEAVRGDERPLISGVFHNRLKKRWYLESCATVQYALGAHKPRLTFKDVRVNSPYNTYRRYGLPPGPICNPGAASLKAALFPVETDDMFFVASSSGAHAFSRYFGEHLKNKNRQKKMKRNN